MPHMTTISMPVIASGEGLVHREGHLRGRLGLHQELADHALACLEAVLPAGGQPCRGG